MSGVLALRLFHHPRSEELLTLDSAVPVFIRCSALELEDGKEPSLSAPPQLIYANNYKNIIMRVGQYLRIHQTRSQN